MTKTYGLFIDGKEIPAVSGDIFPVVSPMDGSLVGYAARAYAEDAEIAVQSARRAAESCGRMA